MRATVLQTSTALARPSPIEGSWLLCDGVVRVTPVRERDGSFVGTVFDDGKLSWPECETDYVRDQEVWDITIEASTPNSTVYRGTFVCDGAKRQAVWEVFPAENASRVDTMNLCPVGSDSCTPLGRFEPAGRRFRVTLTDGRPNKPMNAVGTDLGGDATPNHPLYLTTTAELENVRFKALWDVRLQKFIRFSRPTGTMVIEDLYFVGKKDQVTRLKITGFSNNPEENSLDPGSASGAPSTFFTLDVEVLSSDWKKCPKGKTGSVLIGWNVDGPNDDQVTLVLCGPTREYRPQVPDDKSKVDIELKEIPPRYDS